MRETALSRVRGDPSSPARKAHLFARPLDAILQSLRLRQGLELLQRVVLDLTDALARHAERAADLLERARRYPEQPEAQLDHLTLAFGQGGQRVIDVLAPQRQRRRVERRLRRLVLDEVTELGLLFFADRLLERNRKL